MQTEVTAIFEEYNKAKDYKESLGEKGLFEQGKINERFYAGNQWYGVNSSNDRPLVRHNIIKRIGDFKMSQTLSDDYGVSFFTEGVSQTKDGVNAFKDFKKKIKDDSFSFTGNVTEKEIFAVCKALSEHYRTTAERVDIKSLCARILRNAYINGAGVLYTYFDGSGFSATDFTGERVKGDIKCEVLKISDVCFADGSDTDIQSQPYIILASSRDKQEILRQADIYGTTDSVERAQPESSGKILVLTKLYKQYDKNGTSVKCITVTNGGVLRREFDTKLHLYPISVFRFGEGENSAYGESEITYLIPNQIAVNRMITANVWSSIAAGMPLMLINGDIVSGDITNDPGQIIKIYGTGDDVANAVKFVSPPDFSTFQNNAVDNLIYNTLTQSGAGPAILGDEQAQNASAIDKLQSAALVPISIIKNRYREFLRTTALIWADFWLNYYLKRRIRIEDEDGIWYFPFEATRYKDVDFSVKTDIIEARAFTNKEKIAMLDSLFDRGIINKEQYLSRLPESLIDQRAELLEQVKENSNESK
ncbi:MAG: hypothetical protein J5659_05710 [Clostridia bacterium]|nr:hypothetical protein [Clostridia bacterium]